MKIKNLLEAGLPCLLRGKPGISKSSYLRALAEQNNRKTVDLRVAMMPPEDLVGIPQVAGDGFTYAPPQWAVDVAKDKGAGLLVVLEEIHLAPPAMHAALYQLLQEKEVAGIDLSEAWIAATANYSEDAGTGWSGDMPPALLDRLEIVEASGLAELSGAAVEWLRNLSKELGVRSDIVKAIGLESGNLCTTPRSTERALRLIAAGCRDNVMLERRCGSAIADVMSCLMGVEKEEDIADTIQYVVGTKNPRAAYLNFEELEAAKNG